MTLTFGSLFAGIGGIDLGFERAGMKCLWQVEINEYCRKVLAKNFPGAKQYGDITKIEWGDVEPVDVLAGGFPCQPHSVAGKRLASADERDLWGEFVRAIRCLRPKWVMAENVPGLLSSENGRFFGRVLRDLAESGYDAEWQIIPASAFGAPHVRERLFIIAYNIRKRWAGILRDNLFKQPKKEDYWKTNALGKFCNPFLRFQESAGEPALFRMDFRIPNIVDRLDTLGNAVVPQVAEYIGRLIVEADE